MCLHWNTRDHILYRDNSSETSWKTALLSQAASQKECCILSNLKLNMYGASTYFLAICSHVWKHRELLLSFWHWHRCRRSSHILKFYVNFFFVMDKVLSDKLSCTQTGLCNGRQLLWLFVASFDNQTHPKKNLLPHSWLIDSSVLVNWINNFWGAWFIYL